MDNYTVFIVDDDSSIKTLFRHNDIVRRTEIPVQTLGRK